MQNENFDFGMIGLGTMGGNLALNMSDHGYSVAGFDKDPLKVELISKQFVNRNVFVTSNLNEFISVLKKPKSIILLVPAGKIVDEVIDELLPFLSKDDLLMDCGNSHFSDTNIRIDRLTKSSIHFMGIGISGGESGARHGPSIMPGGPKDIYDRVSDMLKSVSAKVDDQPCVAWLGPGSSGHYVKMVHNGIEYGLMQLISETYHLLKVAAGLNNDELSEIFSNWNKGKLHSFLIEITADIFSKKDELSDNRIIDIILDSAHQKGTGGWTSQDAINLQVPIPVIDLAVTMRDLSAFKKERIEAQILLKGPQQVEAGKIKLEEREDALYFSMVTTYAQGMALLYSASGEYKYDLKLQEIAKIWRGGCIIRASILDDISNVFKQKPDLSNLLFSDLFSKKLMNSQIAIRRIIQQAVESGIPVPGMMGALVYYDSFRSGWLPANLIQAQRDYFGAHTYERNDRPGIFHTKWEKNI